MGYRLVYTEGAAKDIRKLHQQVKQRLKLVMEWPNGADFALEFL